jgi:hypothetical protein
MRNIVNDHRMKKERRSWNARPDFPMLDSNNVMVHEDRRVSAERRGYELSEVTLEEIAIEDVQAVSN